jgi:hypothetical protein
MPSPDILDHQGSTSDLDPIQVGFPKTPLRKADRSFLDLFSSHRVVAMAMLEALTVKRINSSKDD